MNAPHNKGHIFVAFRNDDPSAAMDLDRERPIFSIFERHSVPQTLGVVPNISAADVHDPKQAGEMALDRNGEVVEFLRKHMERTGSEVAMHGYTHRTNRFSRPRRREHSEFRGLSLPEQQQMIEAGTEIITRSLHIKPFTFIPPWNQLDQNTLLACARSGYRAVSAGPFTPSHDSLIPFGANIGLEELLVVLPQARAARGPVLFNVLFHSRTLTSDEVSLLQAVVETVAEDPACETLTVRDAVLRFPELLAEVGEAARNIVPFDETPGTVRSRSLLYFHLGRRVGAARELDELRSQALGLFRQGDYQACGGLRCGIDRRCHQLLWMGRSLLVSGGFLLGLVALTLSRKFGEPGSAALAWWAPILPLLIGVGLARWVTASDTRKEALRAGLLASLGLAVGVVLGTIWK